MLHGYATTQNEICSDCDVSFSSYVFSRLYAEGIELDDSRVLADYNIQRNNKLSLEKLVRVTIHDSEHVSNFIELKVGTTETFGDVKRVIHDVEGIPPDEQRITDSKDAAMADSRTLGECNLHESHTFNLARKNNNNGGGGGGGGNDDDDDNKVELVVLAGNNEEEGEKNRGDSNGLDSDDQHLGMMYM